ncbi:MAG: hypothetical protein ACRDK4_03525 [Solirubrobacteraceae bacterium]
MSWRARARRCRRLVSLLLRQPQAVTGYLLLAGDCLVVALGIVALILATTWAGRRRVEVQMGAGYLTQTSSA